MSRYESFSSQELVVPLVTTPNAGSAVQLTLTPASVAAATSAYQNFTVAGLRVGDLILPTEDPIANSVAVTSARCTVANTLAVQFTNPTAGALTPTAGAYKFLIIKTA